MKPKLIVFFGVGIVLFFAFLWLASPGHWNGCTVRIQRRHAGSVTDSIITTISNPSPGATVAFGSKNIRWYGMEAPKEGAVSLAGQWLTDRWREKQMAYEFGSSKIHFAVAH